MHAQGLARLLQSSSNPCTTDPYKSEPWCDYTKDPVTRAQDLVSRIQTTDKPGLFQNGASGVDSLGISGYQWWSEALHGVAHSPGVKFGGATPVATSFPQVGITAASYNRTLWGAVGSAIGIEGRAFANQGNAGLTFWAPDVNPFRDPRACVLTRTVRACVSLTWFVFVCECRQGGVAGRRSQVRTRTWWVSTRVSSCRASSSRTRRAI